MNKRLSFNARGVSLWGLVSIFSLGSLSMKGEALENPRIYTPPAYTEEYYNSALSRVAPLLALSEEELRNLVPHSAGLFWLTCPHCKIRTRTAVWNWSIQDPGHIVCADCHYRFPDNDEYPYDGKEVVNGIEYPYYTSPEGVRYHFGLAAEWRLRAFLTSSAYQLAELYRQTKEESYAQRALLILDEFAQKFPKYPVIFNGMWIDKETKIAPFSLNEEVDLKEIPYTRRTRWSYWRYMDISRNSMLALDALSSWPGIQTPEGKQARERIFQNMLIPQGDWIQSMDGKYYGNMNASHVYPDRILLARLSRSPERMHNAMKELRIFFQKQFLFDGSWFETSPSYVRQVSGGLNRIANVAKGYSDPEGYHDPETGKRLDDLDLESSPLFKGVHEALFLPRFPDGRLIPLNDTWGSTVVFSPRKQMDPVYLPGLGVGVLGLGKGDRQIHTFLSFTSGTAHKQNDSLSIGLYANGHEQLSTIGYTHTRYRSWARSLMSHNTVVVNGVESDKDPRHTGNIPELFYADKTAGLQIVVARSESAYPKSTSLYRRALLLIGNEGETPYILDLFHIIGGKQHDYLLQGSRDADATVTLTGVEMKKYSGTLMNPGIEFIPPKSERSSTGKNGSNYGYVKNLSQGHPHPDQTEVMIALDDHSGRSIRTLLVTDPSDQVYTGESPSIRRAGGRHFKEDESLLDRYLSPFFCLRRQGENLESYFVATHEALSQSAPHVKAIHTIQQEGVLLIQVVLDEDRVDYILFSPEYATATVDSHLGKLEFQGRYAVLRTQGKKLMRSWLIGGSQLSLNGVSLAQGEGNLGGTILDYSREETSEYRGYFDVDTVFNDGVYSSFQLQFPDRTERSFNVVKIEPFSEKHFTRVYVREDPGFELKDQSVAITSYPQRSIKGTSLNWKVYKVDSSLEK